MPHVFESPRGDRFVILPEEEYKSLVARQRQNNSGVPPFVYEAIATGMAPLKALRQWRGFSQTKLSAAAQLSNTLISRIESGKAKPGPWARERLAEALNVPEDWLRAWPR